MQKITHWQELKSYIASKLEQDEETSFALVPLKGEIQPCDLVSVRHAKRICDVVIVAQLEKTVVAESYIKEAGAHLFVDYIEMQDSVKITAENQDASFLLKLILKILPSAVVVSQDNFPLFSQIKALHVAYEDFFTLLEPNTPQSLYDATQIEIQKSLIQMQQRMNQGVTLLEELTSCFLNDLKNAGLTDIKSLQLKYLDDFTEVRGSIEKDAVLHLELYNNGQKVSFVQKLTVV